MLLVNELETDEWGTIGGAIEVDESPAAAAVREAREEAGVEVALGRILAAVGGPGYHVDYPNGDRSAYVAVVYEAVVAGGVPAPDGRETKAVGWYEPSELEGLRLNSFARSLFGDLGVLPAG